MWQTKFKNVHLSFIFITTTQIYSTIQQIYIQRIYNHILGSYWLAYNNRGGSDTEFTTYQGNNDNNSVGKEELFGGEAIAFPGNE